MLSRILRLSLLCVFLLSLASPGFAARRSSLGGNLLIKDTDDIFFMPQRVSDYNRLVTFDLGTSNSLGSGGMIFGSESIVFGLFTHRSDFMGQVANAFLSVGDIENGSPPLGGRNDYFGTLGPPGPGSGPFQWFDFILGWEGGGNPWGVRLSIGRTQNDGVPANDDKDNVTSVDAIVGFSISDIDISAEFTIGSAETRRVPPTDTVLESSPVGFAVSARKTAVEDSDDLQLGWLGMFNFTSAGRDSTVSATKNEIDNTLTAFVFGAGPVYQPHERTIISAYGTFEYLRESRDDKSNQFKETDTAYVIPGWHVAAEIELASWLQARAGVVSRFAIGEDKEETTAGETKRQFSGLDFDWHTGIGVQLGDFMLDGYLNPQAITTGTDLLGEYEAGEDSNLFGMVTASYAF